MEPLGPGKPSLSSDDIISQFGDSLGEIIKAASEPQYEYERQLVLNRARKNWQFIKGNHFPVPGLVDTPYGDIVDYTWLDGSVDSDENGANVRFMRPINVIGGDLYKYLAVMGSSSPRVKAVSNNPANPAAEEDAENAEACIRDAWIKLEIDKKWPQIAFHQYVTGPAYVRTFFNTDKRKYGASSEPKIDVQMGPDGLPVPVQSGVQEYANGDVEIDICSVLEIEHPFMAHELSDCYYFKCEKMRPKWTLLEMYKKLGQYRDQDLPDSDFGPSSVMAAEARESTATPSGLGNAKRPHLWRFREWWVQPNLYQAVTSDKARQVFIDQFPNGMYIAKAGSVTLEVKDEKVEDAWVACKTGRGPRLLENPICTDSLPMQQWLNDSFNLVMETLLRSIPQTLIRSNLINREAWSRKEPVPGEMILVPPGDGNLSNDLAPIQPARFSDQTPPVIQMVRTYQQDITGIRPEMTGGGPLATTFREAKQRKDQALLGLAPQAHEMQYAAAEVAENIVRLRARFGNGTFTVARKGTFNEVDTVDVAHLAEPGPTATWHAESDDNFPMTQADRWDKMWALLKEFPPEVQQALGILKPINIDQTCELLQIPDFESMLQDQKNKTLADIDQLVNAQPQPDPTNPQQLIPSIAPDPYDDHAFVAEFLTAWLISKTGQRKKQSNPQGFNNVELFQQAHFKMVNPPQPPPPPVVRAGLNVTAKPEDLGPDAMQSVMQGAGLQGNLSATPPVSPSTAAKAALPEHQNPPIVDSPEAPAPHLPPSGPEPISAQPLM